MARKKRNAARRSNQSQPPSTTPAPPADSSSTTGVPAATVVGGVSNVDHSPEPAMETPAEIEATSLGGDNSNANTSSSYASIKHQCEQALTALHLENHDKALRLMNDLCWRHDNSPHSALIHRVQGTVCAEVSSFIDDANAKQRQLRNAIGSASKAVSLSPSSIEFANFYANLLYKAANEGNEYEEVVVECERALAIENPVDPAKESLRDENELEISTAEARVANLQSQLRSLIYKSNIAILSTWMKSLDFGKEKFWLAPTRKVPEDPNKKVSETPEEGGKDIEVKVAAARLLQQMSESSKLRNYGDNNGNTSKGIDSGAGSDQRAMERRKSGSVRKTASSDERRDLVRSYWNSMSSDEKKGFLRIKISNLRAHIGLPKDGTLGEVLDEALSFGKANKEWRFWTCCRCNEKFADAGLFMQHVMEEHMGSLLPQNKSVPSCVEKEWTEMLLNFSCKPLDLKAAIRMHDIPDSSPGRKKSVDTYTNSMQDRTEFQDVEWMDCDGDQSSKGILLNENLPSSDDPERAKLLERIHAIFQALIKHNYLASRHLKKVIRFAMEELRPLASGSPLISNMHRTPLCICFLGAPELKTILRLLHEISQSCSLSNFSDQSNVIDDSNTVMQDIEIMEKIIFSPDASFLVLDEKFLPCKFPLLSCDAVVDDVSSAPTSSHISYDNGVMLDSDALLSWIFTGASSGEQLTSWKHARAKKAQQGLEILQSFEKESLHLHSLCESKIELLDYEKVLKEVRNLCLDEKTRREHVNEFVHQGYDSVLKKRREELNVNDNEITVSSNRIELDAITNVLKNAESLYVSRFGDLGSGEDDDCVTKDYLPQVDSCIEAAIEIQKHQVSIEICKVDAGILRIIAGMRQSEVMINPASSNDYRRILIPLVKSFMRACLEDLAEKDAVEKSNAAGEAFLAELPQDSKNNGAGLDSSKHMHERTKDKKKSKQNRKNKDLKATPTCSAELQDHTAKEMLLPSAREAEGQGSGIAVPGCDDALQQQEEEYKLRINLEANARKLEQYLEYQRSIENEAKQKLLAEQHKKIPETSGGKAETVAKLDAYLGQNDGEKYATRSAILKDGAADILEDEQKNTAGEALLRTGAKTLRQLQTEDDASEERFQADLKKAVRRSLVMTDGDNRMDTYGTGLKNEIGEYSCFLNVIIQSLWHLRRFRDEFLWRSSSEHAHVGDPCVICALFDIFLALRTASKHNRREAVASTSLRVALSNLYPDSNFFQEGQMNDASEVLGVIFNCLHQSFTQGSVASDTKSVESICTGPCPCIVHSTFGMDILERMNCHNCGLKSRYLNHTSFFRNINASALRTTKVMCSEKSFDELLNLIELSHQLACDPEAGGCGKLNYIHHILSTPPQVLITVMGWQTTCESVEDIKATLEALSTEIDISVLYGGLDQQRRHRLVSVICYFGLHYHCFAYSHDHEQWILYDDETVKVIGDWNDVLTKCERGHLQPQLLLFEAVN